MWNKNLVDSAMENFADDVDNTDNTTETNEEIHHNVLDDKKDADTANNTDKIILIAGWGWGWG